ncbi:hypothetical protein PICMEDRAFT_17367 [Pichia membranifaciens NRRL Y-2026]|uniref:Hydantoin racemase n=1 Tax=Pichia membranifaciens NRRL Y-2026 TaxID=763406 RepID=A0A1E3NLF1_9ASCO|nr:hypothetical protein PICMEDRAFT_17367 [Pichia membranifaciens NRRL Y-2026]ODQ46173.1 hypothetical protein PICMEDRAFT_17367 [Pichia membranifaciens NRRL Y-2026]
MVVPFNDKLTLLPHAKGSCIGLVEPNKVQKILLINPNSTKLMTTNCIKMVEQYVPPDAIVYGYTAPETAPTTVEGHLDGVISSADVMRDAYSLIAQADACLVACFSEHPLINCIREEFDIPVCGIMEAAIYSAKIIGGRFGIITTVYRSQIRHEDGVMNYGISNGCAGLLSTGLKVAELHTKPREEVLEIMRNVATKLITEKDADTLLLGCAGMTDMKLAVEDAVKPYGVIVIDGVVSGVNILSGLVRSGLKTSKRGLFCSSLESRTARGQNWL